MITLAQRLDRVYKKNYPWEYADNEAYPGQGCVNEMAYNIKNKPEEVIEFLLNIIEGEDE